MESRTEIEEKERLFDKNINQKDRLAITYVVLFSIILRDIQITNQLDLVFIISIIFYWRLLSKISYSSASTATGKRILAALNVCGVIASFVFSFAAVSYIIGLLDSGYSAGLLYFWLGVLVLGSIMSKSLFL